MGATLQGKNITIEFECQFRVDFMLLARQVSGHFDT